MALGFGLPPAQRQRLHFRLRTRHRWVEGYVPTIHRRLIDLLNSEDSQSALLLEEALVQSRHGAVAESAPRLTFASVNLAGVFLAVPVEDSQDAPPPQERYEWVRKQPTRVTVGIGPYDVEGNVYLLENGDPRQALQLLRTRFIAIGDATLRHVEDPSVVERHGVVLVNRDRLDYLASGNQTSPSEEAAKD